MSASTVSTQQEKLVLLFLTLILFGCKTTTPDTIDPKQSTQKEYLEFNTFNDFIQKASELSKKNFPEIEQWEGSQGLVSLRKVFDKVVAKEAEHFDLYENKNPKFKLTHSQFALNHQDSWVESSEGGIEMNVSDWSWAPLLNEHGVVKIGNVFHQFTKAKSKLMMNVKKVDILKSLTDAEKTNISKGIYVYDVVSTRVSVNTGNGEKNQLINSRQCDNTNGDYKLIGYEEVDQVTYSNQKIVDYYYDSNCDCINSATQLLVTGTYYVSQLKIRTLKWVRVWPFNGYWTDRSSGLQAASGSFKIDGTYSNPVQIWFTDLNYKFNPAVTTNYSINNTKGETATFYYTLYASTNRTGFNQSSSHAFIWNSSGCSCNIFGFP